MGADGSGCGAPGPRVEVAILDASDTRINGGPSPAAGQKIWLFAETRLIGHLVCSRISTAYPEIAAFVEPWHCVWEYSSGLVQLKRSFPGRLYECSHRRHKIFSATDSLLGLSLPGGARGPVTAKVKGEKCESG